MQLLLQLLSAIAAVAPDAATLSAAAPFTAGVAISVATITASAAVAPVAGPIRTTTTTVDVGIGIAPAFSPACASTVAVPATTFLKRTCGVFLPPRQNCFDFNFSFQKYLWGIKKVFASIFSIKK